MAFQAVPDTASVTIRYSLNGEIMENTVHAEKPGGYTIPNLQLLADLVDGKVGVFWKPIQPAAAIYADTTVRGLAEENDFVTTAVLNAGPGALIVSALPGNVTFSIKKASAQTGRSARGRLYWIGPHENMLTSNENVFNILDAIAMVDAVEEVREGIQNACWTPVIVSRFQNKVQRAFGVTFNWVTTSSVDNFVDSQRGRLAGG